MKKKKVWLRLGAAVLCFGTLCACSKTDREIKDEDTYASEIEAMGIFDSTVADALPQTIIHKLIMEHFEAPLPEGKTVKKAFSWAMTGSATTGLKTLKTWKTAPLCISALRAAFTTRFPAAWPA